MAFLKEAGLGVLFRVQLHQLSRVHGHKGDKGDVMILGHRMFQGYIKLIILFLYLNFVFLIRLFRLRNGKGNSATGVSSLTNGLNDIPAQGANIKRDFFHILHDIFRRSPFAPGMPMSPCQ